MTIKRKSLEFVKNNTIKPLIGMEVGVYAGDNALNILENLNIKKLFLVDPYIIYSDYNIIDLPMSLEDAKQEALQKTRNYPITWIYKKFEDCSAYIFDNLDFDFIYIDGDHSSEAFEKDLNLAAILIKENGFLCGHDANFNKIKLILDKWVEERGLILYLFNNNFDNSVDWLIKKGDINV